ncbi:CopD family protein [Halomicrobium salinisoli]|uniref:CopD family protein n=1 Tax=Halomicrobium salinisoli TaxID=2878391 RepID=UPI001CF0AB27|nr:CopD family protein [Halomicrobium salinisoli]
MAGVLHLAVRTLHVLGAVALLGGAAALWIAARDRAPSRGHVRRYEWTFWGVLGVVVATGVGNAGALGPPGPDTRWGAVLTVKLALVVALVLGSLVRTLAVATAGDAADGRFYRRAYGATTAVLAVLVVLAEVLAHG